MEVSRLSGDIKYLGTNGVTLNIDERTRLDLSCSQLASDIKQDQILFWGKIRGKLDIDLDADRLDGKALSWGFRCCQL